MGPNLFICGLYCNPTSWALNYTWLVQAKSFSLYPHSPLLPLSLVIPFFLIFFPSSQCFPLFPPSVFSFSLPPPISPCVFQPPLSWPYFFFYSLTLVGLSSLPFSHFTCISTSTRIPRNPHTFRELSWNLFQMSNSVW